MAGPVDLYAFDGYPGGTCRPTAPRQPEHAPDWGILRRRRRDRRRVGVARTPRASWPSSAAAGSTTGASTRRRLRLHGAARRAAATSGDFYCTNLANGITIQNFYMTFGGHVLGLAARAGRLHVVRLRRGDQRGAAASTEGRHHEGARAVPAERRPDHQSGQGRRGRRVVDRGEGLPQRATTTPGRTSTSPCHNPSSATTNDSFTFPLSTARRQLHRAAVGRRAAQRAGREDAGGRLHVRRPAPRLLHLRADDPLRAEQPRRARCSTAATARPARRCCATRRSPPSRSRAAP